MPSIAMNSFAKRQTADSRFSHFGGTFEELCALIEANFENQEPGDRDGIILVTVPAEGFFSGVVQVTADTELLSSFEARRDDEAAFVQTVALDAQKMPAQHVQVVLFNQATLGDDASTDADWEVISINARATEGEEPMTPMAMARNFLGLEGGTLTLYTADQFAEAIIYWSDKVMVGKRPEPEEG